MYYAFTVSRRIRGKSILDTSDKLYRLVDRTLPSHLFRGTHPSESVDWRNGSLQLELADKRLHRLVRLRNRLARLRPYLRPSGIYTIH